MSAYEQIISMKSVFVLLFSLLCISGAQAQRTVGLLSHTSASEDGYVLFAPIASHTTYLIDKCGKEVHSWQSSYGAGNSAYLLPDGSLLRANNSGNAVFTSGSPGGTIERVDWDGTMRWSSNLSSTTECQHHDVCMMPNGNVLAIAWEVKSQADAIAAGRDPGSVGNTIWTEKIVELEPTGLNTANIVWEWDIWDHLVQDQAPTLSNYGTVSAHPELVNINHPSNNPANPDWLHLNGIAYNADLDQIVVSSFFMSELWIIDHGTTTTEAAGHDGGKQAKGGDLLYRWGNPAAYARGTAADQKLFALHNPHWIEKGLPDAGKIIIFNNGQNRPLSQYSTVDIIDPPVDTSGAYTLSSSSAFGPLNADWQYKAQTPEDFYSPILSGAERLPNGNTLVCEGSKGTFFELDAANNIVWKYVSPVAAIIGPVNQGDIPGQNYVFRAVPYPASYPAFAGRTLAPGPPIERNPIPYDCFFISPTSVGNVSAGSREFHAENPFGADISLSSDGPARQIGATLMNYLGQACGQWTLSIANGKPTRLAVPQSLAPGMYLLRVDDGSSASTLRLQHY